MKNEKQSQNLLLKVDPRSTFRYGEVKNGKHRRNGNETMLHEELRVLYLSPPLWISLRNSIKKRSKDASFMRLRKP